MSYLPYNSPNPIEKNISHTTPFKKYDIPKVFKNQYPVGLTQVGGYLGAYNPSNPNSDPKRNYKDVVNVLRIGGDCPNNSGFFPKAKEVAYGDALMQHRGLVFTQDKNDPLFYKQVRTSVNSPIDFGEPIKYSNVVKDEITKQETFDSQKDQLDKINKNGLQTEHLNRRDLQRQVITSTQTSPTTPQAPRDIRDPNFQAELILTPQTTPVQLQSPPHQLSRVRPTPNQPQKPIPRRQVISPTDSAYSSSSEASVRQSAQVPPTPHLRPQTGPQVPEFFGRSSRR